MKILKIDRALYQVDTNTKTYKYYARNPDWKSLSAKANYQNKESLDGYTRIFPDGKRKVFRFGKISKSCCQKTEIRPRKKYTITKENPCPECYGWGEWFSTCDHKSYICNTCGRKQCLLHWPYPMKTESEAIHFLKGAEVSTGKKCFVRHAQIGGFDKWKIFTSKEDYRSYLKTRKHKR